MAPGGNRLSDALFTATYSGWKHTSNPEHLRYLTGLFTLNAKVCHSQLKRQGFSLSAKNCGSIEFYTLGDILKAIQEIDFRILRLCLN